MNGKIFYALKIIFMHLIGFSLCALQAYISMYEYKDEMSSACVHRCPSYINDVLTSSLFFYLFFLFAYFLFFHFAYLLSKIKKLKKGFKIIFITAIYATTWIIQGSFFFNLFFLFIYLFFLFVYIFPKTDKLKKVYKIIPIIAVYLFACFTVNEMIFDERVRSWDTYTTMEGFPFERKFFIAIVVTTIIFYRSINRLIEKR